MDLTVPAGNVRIVAHIAAVALELIGILKNFIGRRADLTGNGVPDVLFAGDNAGTIYPFLNENGAMSAPGLPMLTEENSTLY